MLGSKNTYNSGKCSLGLPLQFHCNLQFFDTFEIEVTERVGRKWVSSRLYPAYFSQRLTLSFAAVCRRRRRRFLLAKISFQAEFSCLYFEINFVAEFWSVQKLWLFPLLTLPSFVLGMYTQQSRVFSSSSFFGFLNPSIYLNFCV